CACSTLPSFPTRRSSDLKFQPAPTSGIQEFYTLGNTEIEIQIQYDIGFFAFPVIIEMDFRLGKKILFDDLEEFIQSVRGLKYNCPAQLPIGIGFLWECHILKSNFLFTI